MPKADYNERKRAYNSAEVALVRKDLESLADSMIGDFEISDERLRTLYGLLCTIKRMKNFTKTEE